jgi:Trk K+ transport system NAD-binding subunit
MFDQQMADNIRQSFGFAAYSASALAAPALAAAATRAAVEHSFYLNDVLLNISRLTVNPDSALVGKRVGEVEQELDLSIILHSTADGVDFHPPSDQVLAAGDRLVVLAPLEALSRLHRLNALACPEPQRQERRSWLDRLRKRSSAPGRSGP